MAWRSIRDGGYGVAEKFMPRAPGTPGTEGYAGRPSRAIAKVGSTIRSGSTATGSPTASARSRMTVAAVAGLGT
jgi:hypothetical protein